MGTVFMALPDGRHYQEVAVSYQETKENEGYVVVTEKVDSIEAASSTNVDEVIVKHSPITVKEASAITGKAVSTIRKYMSDGKLTNIGKSGAPLVCKNEVIDLMQSE